VTLLSHSTLRVAARNEQQRRLGAPHAMDHRGPSEGHALDLRVLSLFLIGPRILPSSALANLVLPPPLPCLPLGLLIQPRPVPCIPPSPSRIHPAGCSCEAAPAHNASGFADHCEGCSALAPHAVPAMAPNHSNHPEGGPVPALVPRERLSIADALSGPRCTSSSPLALSSIVHKKAAQHAYAILGPGSCPTRGTLPCSKLEAHSPA